MEIDLTWVNLSENADGHHIYRSTDHIDPEDLPEPHITLSGRTKTWTDTRVKRGERYYYRIGTFKGEDFALSPEQEANALPDTGPGPSELLYGDYESGYFGILQPHELVSGPELKAVLGHQLNVGIAGQTWAKVANRGKILFIPIGHQFGTHSWREVYREGLALGIDSVGEPHHVAAGGGIEVNQLRTFTKFGRMFKVRLLSGIDEGIGELTASTTSPDVSNSEYNQTIVRLAAGSYEGRVGIDLPGVRSNQITTGAMGVQLCQDVIGSRVVSRRILRNVYSNSYFTFTTTDLLSVTATATHAWKPIIELINE